MAESEGIQAEPAALQLIARQSTGAMRDAISLLDQLASGGQPVTLALTQQLLGTAASQAVIELVQAIIARQVADGLDSIHRALDGGVDPRQLARQVVDYLRDLLLIRMDNAGQVDAAAELRAQMASQSQALSVADLLRLIRLFNSAGNDARSAWQPALPLELALVEAVELPKPAAAPEPPAAPGQEPIFQGEHPASPQPAPPRRPAATSPASSAEKPGAHSAAQDAPQNAPQQPAEIADLPALEGEAQEGSESRLTVQMVTDHWRQITSLVRQRNPNTEALLKSGRLLGVKDGVIYFGFSEVLKHKMEKKDNMDLVLQALQQAFGFEVPFRCVNYMGKAGLIPPDVDSDGMVATALRDLGGEIVDIQ
jgi:DNA polymerase-3 subunit gamma/tau